MSNLRTSRTRLTGAAATVVLAALSLTACGNGTGAHDEGAAAATTTTANSSSGASSSASGANSSSSSSSSSDAKPDAAATRPATHTSAPKAPASSGKPVTCEGSNTRTVAAPLNRPVNHMLLTVTNTGSKSCYLYGYPAVRFGEAQAVPPVIEESQPQAVVTLGPGESGYASVSLSATDGSGSNGHTVKSLTVYFHGPSGNESVGAGAHPSLPAKGAYVDDSLKVTYWQQSMDDAVNW
ncbi:hypothetical protein AQI88_40080 [Streptomyces cellostaticus]|uniref:DUF4232 domain-containing protein n=1 Tax=Streptomyces cellostaticus TaxID=67285 RepID=A0A101N8N1_9ACTN|nr:DUF4232 domain-containing protein [Streptomyces cellostaticus]KUM88499.1 hypothetical protein AQI88_40080 [Streptomyces cellostaticus]